MPTITLNKKNVLKLVGKNIDDKTLKNKISMLGTDLENITKEEIIVEIFPNRPDMLSEQGFARALSSFLGIKKGLRTYKIKDSKQTLIVEKSVNQVRPYTACAIIKNLKLTKEKIREIIQIQEKLHISFGRNRKKLAIGIYPMEEIKFPITYKAEKPEKIRFTPLDTAEEMYATEILDSHPKGIEYKHLLEGKKLYPIFIDKNNNILSMPPIINSNKTGKVKENTNEIFIECSGFDLNYLNKCLNIIVTALADMGGEIYSMKIKYPDKTYTSPNLKTETMALNLNYINKRLGLNLNQNKAKQLLERMGYGVKANKVIIPAYRVDILHQIDLGEDIAIAYGYDNFIPKIPNISTIGKEDEFEQFKNKIANLLIGFGLLETNSFSLIPKKDLEKMNITYKAIEVENPATEHNTLRNWITPSLLKILSENKHNEYPQNIFEIGKCFTNKGEFTRLSVTLCNEKANYTEIMKILNSLLTNLGIKYKVKETNHNSFIDGRVARIQVKPTKTKDIQGPKNQKDFLGNKEVAYIGELTPAVIRNFDLDMPVSCFELNLTELYKVL